MPDTTRLSRTGLSSPLLRYSILLFAASYDNSFFGLCHYEMKPIYFLKSGDRHNLHWVLPSLVVMLNIIAFDRKQVNCMCLQRLEDVKEEDHLIKKI